MLVLKIYSIFVITMLLIGVANSKNEDRAAIIAACVILTPVLITLIYGGAC